MKNLIFIFLFCSLNSAAQTINKQITYLEIKSKGVIDSTLVIINSNRIVSIKNGEEKIINTKYKEPLLQFIKDFFITKNAPIFKQRERIEGYTYSEHYSLTINVTFNDNEKDNYYINLSEDNYKVEYSEEFKEFLKFFYRKIDD